MKTLLREAWWGGELDVAKMHTSKSLMESKHVNEWHHPFTWLKVVNSRSIRNQRSDFRL